MSTIYLDKKIKPCKKKKILIFLILKLFVKNINLKVKTKKKIKNCHI